MASLGSFGAALREYAPPVDPDTFEFVGETFEVVGEIPAMIELTMSAALAGKVSGLEGDAAFREALRTALTVPEREVDGETLAADTSRWRRFYELAVTRNVASEDLTALALGLLSAQLGRPTVRPSTSSDGQPPTSTSSSSSSSPSPDAPVYRPVDEVLAG